MPDFHFGLNDDLYKRVTKRFENELALWNADENCHLLFIGTFATTKAVIDKLTAERRSFVLGLRYNPAFFCHRTRYNTDPLLLFLTIDGRLRASGAEGDRTFISLPRGRIFLPSERRGTGTTDVQGDIASFSELDQLLTGNCSGEKEPLGLSFSSPRLSVNCR